MATRVQLLPVRCPALPCVGLPLRAVLCTRAVVCGVKICPQTVEPRIGFEPASAAHPRCMKVMQCNVNGCAPFIKLQARTEDFLTNSKVDSVLTLVDPKTWGGGDVCTVASLRYFVAVWERWQVRTEAGSWVTLLGHIQTPDPGKWAVIRTPLKPAKAGQGVSKPIKQYYDHHAGVKTVTVLVVLL